MPMEWFRDFDPLRSGKVTSTQFRRCFINVGYSLTDREFELLNQEFGADGFVNYQQFVDTIQRVFTNIDLETHPLEGVDDPHSLVARTLKGNQIANYQRLDQLLKRMVHQVKTKGVHIRESYMDFDKHNNGFVTQSQFLRNFPFQNFSAEEKKFILDIYLDPVVKDVNYKQLVTDVNEAFTKLTDRDLSKSSTFLSHQLNSIKTKTFDSDHNVLLENFAAKVREQRMRILDFFASHDPLHLGRIPRGKFQGVLTQFAFPFTKNDLEYLADQYSVTIDFTEYDKYQEFCADVEAVVENQNSTLTRAVTTVPKNVDPILNKIRGTMKRNRINLLPILQDFDRQNRGLITSSQFYRALSTMRIYVNQEELDKLAEAYKREEGVDIYKFIEDVDSDHKQKRREFRPIGIDKESIISVFGSTPTGDKFVTPEVADDLIAKSKRGLLTKVNEQSDLQGLLQNMKKWGYINSVHFHDFLSDFDRHKWGEITATQFRSALTMSHYPLTDDEFDILVKEYTSNTREGYMQWKRFADDVLQVIAPLDLEKDPLTTPIHPREATSPTLKSRGSPPSDVNQILSNVAKFVRSRRISLIEQFQDKDRANHKRVSAIGFAQIIQLIGIHISKNEIDKLCSYYNDPSCNFVDYTKFCQDIESYSGQIFGDRAGTSLVVNPIPKYSKEDSPYLISRKSTDGYVESWEETKSRLQTFVFKRRIRLYDFFLAFDNLRKGYVTKQKFRTVVGQVNLPLTAPQIDNCIDWFSVEGMDDMFDYSLFCKEINQIFGQTELHLFPQDLETFATSRALPDPSSTLQTLSTENERKLKGILQRMKVQVCTRRMNIREQFMDYDKAPHKNYITQQQFKQSIARLGLTADPHEFEILCKHYRCTDLDDMNYLAFCKDIDY